MTSCHRLGARQVSRATSVLYGPKKNSDSVAVYALSRALSQCHGRLFLVTPLILNLHVRVVFLLLILGWSVFYIWKRSDMYYILYATITSLLANLSLP